MGIQIRPATPDEFELLHATVATAFGEAPSERFVEQLRRLVPPERTLCAFDGPALVAGMNVLPLRVRWGDGWLPMGGVSGVGTLPTHRRQGLLRSLMERALAEMHERGEMAAILYASLAAIYHRYGYGVATAQQRMDARRDAFRWLDDDRPGGRVRLVQAAAAASQLGPVYERWAELRTLALARTPEWWRLGVLNPPELEQQALLTALHEGRDGPDGYVLYRMAQGAEGGDLADGWPPHQRLVVRELVATRPAAYRALWDYLLRYDLVDTYRVTHAPADDPLFHMVQDPRHLNGVVHDGLYMRPLNCRALVEGRRYGGDGRLVLELRDPLCRWNDGRWLLEADSGGARFERTELEPELWLEVGAFATLVSGCAGAGRLAAAGRVRASDDAIELAERLFRVARAPFCADGF